MLDGGIPEFGVVPLEDADRGLIEKASSQAEKIA